MRLLSSPAMEATRAGIVAAIRGFLEVAGGENGAAPDERALVLALDRLALVAHVSELPDPLTDVEAPAGDYESLAAHISARFPTFGFYRAADLELEGEATTGDAIDDLTDIALDLREVLWLLEHAGEADALWAFHFGFRAHWGSHLRALQWFLHGRAQGTGLTG
jgi:hypothetical protein